ncbi:MAG: TonB-dependent receptor [Rhizobium sp.]|nr:MAG: TonB-dependent receptor [Rhizobium sp.]
MKAPLHAAVLAAFFAVPAITAQADDSAADPIQLDTVIVTATRSAQAENRLPGSVTVISRVDLDSSAANTVAEALRGVAGAQITDFYGNGTNATVDLRGFGDAAGSNTLILVDGRRLNNTDIGSPDLSSIALKDVERIEIIHGSAGTLYGDQAVGGVINIITRDPKALRVNADVGAGSYRGKKASASVEDRIGGASFRVSGEALGTDNYRAHNKDEYENGLARGGYDYGSGSVFLELGYINQRLQTPGALLAPEVAVNRRQSFSDYQGDFANSRTSTQRLNWQQGLWSDWNLEADLNHRHVDGIFRQSFRGFPSTANSMQDRNVWSFNPRISGGFALPSGRAVITAGIDAQHAEYELSSPIGVQSNNQRERDFYAQAILPLVNALEATVGARVARVDNNVYDGFTFTSATPFSDTRHTAEAGLAWTPVKNLRLYTRYDGNFRFAKVDEFTNAGATPGSNQNLLQTQHGDTYEVGGEWKTTALQLGATLYTLRLRDEIVYDPNQFISINLDSTRRNGVTLTGAWQALRSLKLSANYSYLDAQVTGGTVSGKEVPLVARNNARFAADANLPWTLKAYAEVLVTGSRRLSGDFGNTDPKLPNYSVTNIALSGDVWHFRLQARVNNLFAKGYSEYGTSSFSGPAYFPSPERNFWLSLGYSL